MKLNYFKDKLFDLLNEAEDMRIKDITTIDKEDKFMVEILDGSIFEIKCRKLKPEGNTDEVIKRIPIIWRISHNKKKIGK